MPIPIDAATLAALARTQRVLLAPHEFADEQDWRARLAAELRVLFGADHVLVLRAGAPLPYVGDGFDRATLDAMASYHVGAAEPRVRYRDPTLERLQARRLADPDPVFTRARNETAMGRSVEGTPMFDAVCRPLGITDFSGLFARTPHGDAMLFVAHGRRPARAARRGADAERLLRVLAPGVPAALALSARDRRHPHGATGDAGPPADPASILPDGPALRARFGLTPREADVACALACGRTLKQVAAQLGVSASTARFHTEAVFRKLGVRTRGAVALALLGRPDGDALGRTPRRARSR